MRKQKYYYKEINFYNNLNMHNNFISKSENWMLFLNKIAI